MCGAKERQESGIANIVVEMAKRRAEDEKPVWEEIESMGWLAVDAVGLVIVV